MCVLLLLPLVGRCCGWSVCMMCVVYGVCCGKQEANKSRLNIGQTSPSSVCVCARRSEWSAAFR